MVQYCIMKNKTLHIRITEEDYQKLVQKKDLYGFKNVSEYIRFCSLNAELKVEVGHVNRKG